MQTDQSKKFDWKRILIHALQSKILALRGFHLHREAIRLQCLTPMRYMYVATCTHKCDDHYPICIGNHMNTHAIWEIIARYALEGKQLHDTKPSAIYPCDT